MPLLQAITLTSARCEGTLYQVNGSPFGGFALNIRRNWDSAKSSNLGVALAVAEIKQQHVWMPTATEYMPDDTHGRADTDKFALNVRPPGVTSRCWIAEEVMDCQDWVVSFVEHMVQRKVIAAEALQATRDAMDAKTALMPAPSGSPTHPGQPNVASQASAARAVTASTIQGLHPTPQQRAQLPSSRSSAQPQVGQSEWVAERSRFERYNHTTGKWEYLRMAQRAWVERP